MKQTGQNTSSAVMQQRQEARDSLDDFPTPPWAVRALIEKVLGPRLGFAMSTQSVWEPACNRGHLARPLFESFGRVYCSDIHDYGEDPARAVRLGGREILQQRVGDFLWPDSHNFIADREAQGVDWIMTNPPFRLAEQFIAKGRDVARRGVAIFQRSAFLEGGERYEKLYRDNPPDLVAQFAERVILHRGVLRDPSKLYWDAAAEKWRRPSTATAYCWLIWCDAIERGPDTGFCWIPPCRKAMERPGDYPVIPGDPLPGDNVEAEGEQGDLIGAISGVRG